MSVCDKLLKRWGYILGLYSTDAGIHMGYTICPQNMGRMPVAYLLTRTGSSAVLGRAGQGQF